MSSNKPTAKKGAAKAPGSTATSKGGFPKERVEFRSLLLSNPNFFGNLKDSAFKPVKAIASNTSFEQMMCVGFNPQLDQLEAVIFINQNGGYGGGICSDGSLEYVRFYLSYDGGANWEDVGVESFNVYDIPSTLPLEFAISHHIESHKKFCSVENLPKVRAILSWNQEPTANTPDFTPVWGNVLEANIQIEPIIISSLGTLFEQAQFQLSDALKGALDLTQTVSVAKPKALSAAQLQAQYRGKNVPDHRFLFPAVQKQIAQPTASGAGLALGGTSLFQKLKVNVADILDAIFKTDGNTTYEELQCVGLNTKDDTLLGVLMVKQVSGYSGPLCSAGSREYVAFWVDWEDGAGWQHVGTTSVTVHDIEHVPPGRLMYAVMMPLNTVTRRQPCAKGAKTAKIRAILAWEQVPPSDNPDFVPTWGNREETRVFIKPGPPVTEGDYKPYLETVGSVPICHIDQTTGFASGERPFGGLISVTGFIPGAPDLLSPNQLQYKVSVRQPPSLSWQTVDNAFGITVLEQIGGGMPVSYDLTQSVDADGFYTFREDMNSTGSGWRLVTGRLLAQWITAQPMTGLWEIKVEVKDPLNPTPLIPAAIITCLPDGTTRQTVKVFLDEIPPTADVKITGFSRDGGPVLPTVDCATLQQGDVIHGKYTTEDEHFSSLSLTIQPVGPAGGATVNPPALSYPLDLPTTGGTGTWTLDTKPMAPCGYVVRLQVSDRTIVSGNGGWGNEDFVGFCLAAKKK
jgi:DNA uptake protein ComE-like DNA-binding protein